MASSSDLLLSRLASDSIQASASLLALGQSVAQTTSALAPLATAAQQLVRAFAPLVEVLSRTTVFAERLSVNLSQITTGFTQIGQGLATMTGAISPLVAALTPLTAGIRSATTALVTNLAGGIDSVVRSVANALAPLAQRAANLYVALEPLGKAVLAAVSPLLSGAGRALGGVANVGSGAIKAVSGTVAGGASVAAGVAGAIAGSFAVPAAAFQAVTSAARSFVAALNPSAVFALDLAARNLTAAFGVALEPIVRVATSILREFNAAITPVMQRLQPIVAQLAQSFGQVASVFTGAFASVLTTLTPAFQFLADIVSATVPVFQAMYAGVAGAVEAIGGVVRSILSYFGVDMGDIMKTFKDSMRALAQTTLEAAATLLRFVDSLAGSNLAGDFIKGAISALTGEGQARRETVAVARNVQTGGIADFASSVARNALLAGPGGVQTKDAEEKAWRERVAKSLDGIAAGQQGDLLKELQKSIAEAARQIVAATVGKVWNPVEASTRVVEGIVTGGGSEIRRGLLGF